MKATSRDPKRIKRILKLVEIAWSKNPELRLFQLLTAIIPDHNRQDNFYTEDKELEGALKNFITSLKKTSKSEIPNL